MSQLRLGKSVPNLNVEPSNGIDDMLGGMFGTGLKKDEDTDSSDSDSDPEYMALNQATNDDQDGTVYENYPIRR